MKDLLVQLGLDLTLDKKLEDMTDHSGVLWKKRYKREREGANFLGTIAGSEMEDNLFVVSKGFMVCGRAETAAVVVEVQQDMQ